MSDYKLGGVDLNNDKVDPVYKKGFEHGYWLQRGNSKDLQGLIEGSKNHTQYSSGLTAGSKQARREKIRESLQSDSNRSRDRDKGLEID